MPESELPPVPEDDDLNATVIEVMTDVEVLLDGSSVIDVPSGPKDSQAKIIPFLN